MARRRHQRSAKLLVTVLAWVVGLLIFFPILWTVLTSFKTEGDAIDILRSSCSSTGPLRTMPLCKSARTMFSSP